MFAKSAIPRLLLVAAFAPAGCADELNTPQNVAGGQEPAQNAPETVEPNGAALDVDSDTPPQTIVYAPLKAGDDAPSFVVTGIEGGPISLTHYYGKQNVVLVFSRANSSPACMDQLVQLQQKYADFQEHGTEVIVVFREEEDGAEGLARSRDHAHAEFPLALDVGAVYTSAYSRTGYQTYVIDREGVIRAVLDGTEDERPTAEEILSQVEQLPAE